MPQYVVDIARVNTRHPLIIDAPEPYGPEFADGLARYLGIRSYDVELGTDAGQIRDRASGRVYAFTTSPVHTGHLDNAKG